LDDPVKGVLDNTTYLLVDNVASDITAFVKSVQIRRGRNREQDEFNTGVANLTARNELRTFDPAYAAGPYFGNIVPGKRVTITAGGYTRFDGLVDDWNYNYPLSKDSTVQFDVVDALAQLGNRNFDAWTTTAGQTAGARLSSICDRPEVVFPATRSFETGTATLQADNVTWGSNVLNYAQLVTKADYGKLFASRDGVLTFLGSAHTYTGVGAPVFSDAGTPGSIEYSGVEIDYGTELLFNRVSVDATGFIKQTVEDAASINSYGVKTLSLANLPLASELQALTLAQYLLALYKQPTSRFSAVTVPLHGLDTAQQNLVLALDIGSVVRVIYTPNGVSTAVDQFCVIDGFDETIGPLFHNMTLSVSVLSAGYNTALNFILDDATFGKLDTGLLAF